MATKQSVIKDTTARTVKSGIDLYFKRIFALMFGAVGVTALAAYMTIWGGGLQYLFNFQTGGMSGLYYVMLFGGLALSIWAQVRVFHMKPTTAALLLMLAMRLTLLPCRKVY